MIKGITTLLIFQLAGELAVAAFHVPVSGSICGMALLLGWLVFSGRAPDDLGKVAAGLHVNMALLFVPVGVGVVTYWDLLRRDWIAIAIALVASTLISIAVTAVIFSRASIWQDWFMRRLRYKATGLHEPVGKSRRRDLVLLLTGTMSRVRRAMSLKASS